MHWHVVHTKPRQEKCALQNLERQGYECFLPLCPIEKLRAGTLAIDNEPLFPRYLFVRLGLGLSDKSWAPIRSTKGVSRLVTFGFEPAIVADELIQQLRATSEQRTPTPLFRRGERLRVTEGPFSGVEAVYQMTEGERRVIVLIELLSKSVAIRVSPTALRKAG